MQKKIRNQMILAALVGLLVLSLAATSIQTTAASTQQGQGLGNSPEVIYVAKFVEGGSQQRLLPPQNFLRAESQTAVMTVNYYGDWDPAAKAAFEIAKSIWESELTSLVPISVDAYWEYYRNPNILGGAMAGDYRRNFAGAPYPDTWYPSAVANKIYGADLNPTSSDVIVKLNSGFTGWYFGTDGNPRWDQYDFVSVVLHEIGHGLGFSGSMSYVGGEGSWGNGSPSPFIYDRFTVNGSGQSLLDTSLFPNGSVALGAQLTGGSLYFNGSRAMAANGGQAPRLYAPSSWEQGSSYSHLDEATYPGPSGNSLMTPALTNGEVIHVPGPIAMGILEDLGWAVAASPTPPVLPTAIPTVTPAPVYTYFTYFPSVLSIFQFH